jgi:oxygen-independent coproporphyrinogen-3 oxidase
MNRRHTSLQAVKSVENARQAGFSDISIDLIFGLPGLSNSQWIRNLRIATSLPVNHISAYHLTIHEGTVFDKWLRKGTLSEITEEESIEQFEILAGIMAATGFEQYEISNFARNSAYSRHNCNYWLGKNYLGLGPSAHSYNGNSRQWNITNLDFYVSSIHSGKPAFESEILSETDKLNDYLITRLRTKWGISTEYIRSVFGKESCDKIIQTAGIYLDRGSLKRVGDEIFLTPEGVIISDQILLSLLVVPESKSAIHITTSPPRK